MINTLNTVTPSIDRPFDPSPPWLETKAQVTECRHQFARMNTFTLSIAPDSYRFSISFTYYAHANTYSGEFTSPVAMEQGKTFAIFYNPLNPRENRHSEFVPPTSGGTDRLPLVAIGVAAFAVVSLLYLSMLHGCN